MRRFITGLVLGVIVGALATLGVLRRETGTRMPEPVDSALPRELPRSEEELTCFLDGHPYEVGFFAKNLDTGKTLERFADRPVCLASIVKAFCLAELFRQKHEGGVKLDQKIDVSGRGSVSLADAADLMIGQSDNAATQALAERLGRENVNRIPALLHIESMSADILPEEGRFRQTLDKRIFGERIAEAGLPQHGTARGIPQYFELLINKEIISQAASADLLDFLSKHPKPFSDRYAGKYEFVGKGGNILWTRPPKHYSMMGWGLLLTKQSGDHIVLCVWGEWFPEDLPPASQSEFLKYVTDSVVSLLERTVE